MRVALAPADTGSGVFYSPNLNGPAAASPDGKIVAFSLARGETHSLSIKHPDRFEQLLVPGGGRMPAFSPDGEWIAFHRGADIWKARVAGGEPVRVGELPEAATAWSLYGLSWHTDGGLFSISPEGLWRLPSAGGRAALVLTSDSAGGVLASPSPAPDGRLLVMLRRGRTTRLALVAPDGTDLRELPDGMDWPGWFVGDILVFTRGGQLSAARFDLKRLRIVGEPVPVTGVTGQSASHGPTAAFFDESVRGRHEFVWVSRSGAVEPLRLPLAFYRHPRLSPDGTRLATLLYGSGIAVFHLATGSRMTLSDSNSTEPVWTRDGRRILTSIDPVAGTAGLTLRAADGSQRIDTLIRPSRDETWPTDIAPGDSIAAYYGRRGDDPSDVSLIHMRTKQARPIAVPGFQRGGRFSPDGKWLAYESHEGGLSKIVVQPWPALDARHVVSIDAADDPSWSRDGRELYFRSGDRMMAVTIGTGSDFLQSAPFELFRGGYTRDLWGDQSYDVAPDGRFLMLRPVGNSRIRVQVIYNWADELRRRLDEANRRN